VIGHEGVARERLHGQNKIELEDRLMRSWGIFTNARRMDTKEFMKLLSDVRLAVDLGILPGDLRDKLDTLMEDVQPASLATRLGRELTAHDRDILRAQVVRETLDAVG
jgi:protein arginine kinase